MPQIKSNFTFKSSEPNFARDRYMNHEEMRSVTIEDIDVGHIVYCNSDQKHYIFKGNSVGFNSELGYFRALELHDTITVDNIEDLTNYPTAGLPEGKLVYCKQNNQIYYYAGNNYNNTETGHFKLLIDMQDSNYVSFESREWEEVINAVEDLSNASMLTFDTITEMATYIPTDFINEGQLAYCKELDRHFYLIKNEDGEFVNDGFYGYFRLVCDADAIKPKITNPFINIQFEYNKEAYESNGWELTEIDGEKILLITNDSNTPNIQSVSSTINRGQIDYRDFPYYEGNPIVTYMGSDDLTSDMYIKQESLEYGNNEFYAAIKASTNIPTPIDINGIEREDLKWDKTKAVESNIVLVNKTKYWFASTDSELTKQPLIPWLEEMTGYATLQATCIYPQQFQLPEGRELKSLYIMGLAGYVKEDLSEWSKNGNIYTYTGSHRGPVQIKVVF